MIMTKKYGWMLGLLAFGSAGAHAERLESPVLLEARNRLVTILHQEPGQPEEIRIDQDVYDLKSVDEAGFSKGFNYSADRGNVAVSILQDSFLLSRMKQNPLQFSKNLHFRNADEVTCPREANAILMVIRTPGPERVGNCLQLERR